MSRSMLSKRMLSKHLLVGAAVVAMLSTTSGCSWVKRKFTTEAPYKESQLSRPLEAPPGLDLPRDASGLAIPAASLTAGAAASSPPGAAVAGSVDAFVLADSLDSTFKRVGLALERIDGVTVISKAVALNSYEVGYGGTTMLVRAESVGGQSRVSAVGADGKPLSGGSAGALLGLLKARLN